ncbi:putative nucleotide-sugar transporter YMD8 [Porphyridium purpureum]|uniref:Putative nucleotide-sugar transporter YMD8 n=1 Tax=Porphyridium purpureum TaxID=35688 RepID=A0A5J4YP04_PORPP|nr:putative nucleotide-sugar transporter YMD8 [Porphyridium purpureum]|eukprot:POR8998..scf295_9
MWECVDAGLRHGVRMEVCTTVALTALWFCLSATIIVVSKELLSGGAFPFPLLLTCNSNVVCFVLALLVTLAITPLQEFKTQARANALRLVPIALSIALEIGCSNVALKMLSVSFGTILKGAAPLFVMLFGIVLKVERFSFAMLACILTISAGLALATLGEIHGGSFGLLGALLQLVATALGGLRWALTQRVMVQQHHLHTHDILPQGRADIPASESERRSSRPDTCVEDLGEDGVTRTATGASHRSSHAHQHGAHSPLEVILYSAPWTAILLLPVALPVEAARSVREASWTLTTILALVAIGCMVFSLMWTEYALVQRTSSLAVSVAAVFKELVTIVAGVLVFGDHMDALNWVGFVVAQLGISAFVLVRHAEEVNRSTLVAVVHSENQMAHDLLDEDMSAPFLAEKEAQDTRTSMPVW